ncbi:MULTISPECIES: ATP-binding cassette domain-containing protein [Gordonia]|uniref:Putative ABC transporter ATP-binding protein n=1 Tax=Gordonia sihwensis NBRC 108236 TaxID=1223544 RepID=L7LHJ6_9ACTN|nr:MULTISPECIES: ATP-binding cassette domain-containing protein [Gordonia]MBY4571527.1 ABC transporter ATP-binding protein [Gordonia sihwensis]GAC59518.1 putative ABC transporter ATP-binding protein [Gordonia sihwensis NBRC 108236]
MTAAVASLAGVTVDVSADRGRRRTAVRVLDDVSLELAPGTVTALIGESGCGKSMVASALCELLPVGSVATGRVRIGDRTLDPRDSAWHRVRGREVGLVPQSPATSFTPVRTIGSHLSETVTVLGADRSVRELADAVAYPAWALDRYPHEVSGGMAQRAAIAAAVAGRPRVLVADEPTSALDPELAAATWRLLAGAAADGAGVLVVTHDIETLRQVGVCDAIAVMREGRLLARFSAGEFDGLASTSASDAADAAYSADATTRLTDDEYIAQFLQEVR